MRVLRAQRTGFTLVELLIVIAIIVVLMAIALPVFSRARERAHQATCMANLHQIAQAIRMYRMDEGAYPGAADPITGQGGINALYPTYISNRQTLICPDDPIDTAQAFLTKREFSTSPTTGHAYSDLLNNLTLYLWQDGSGTGWKDSYFADTYTSYNRYYNYFGYVNKAGDFDLLGTGNLQHVDPGENIAFVYEWYRYDPDNVLGLDAVDPMTNCNYCWTVNTFLGLNLAQQIYWNDYHAATPDSESQWRLKDSLGRPLWDYDDTGWYYDGLPSAVFPGLINRNAPDNTIITRCPNHRPWSLEPKPGSMKGGNQGTDSGSFTYTQSKDGKDIVLRLDGSAKLVPVYGANYDWAIQSPQTQ